VTLASLEDDKADLALKLRNLLAQRRLRNSQTFGSTREAQFLSERDGSELKSNLRQEQCAHPTLHS
jgi:hypothetical protein